MSTRPSRKRRIEKTEKIVKPKFVAELDIESKPQIIPKFVPVTDRQKEAIALLRSGVRMLFLKGSAGTGKSMLAAWWASKLMDEKKIDQIVLVRPAVATGKSVGLLPGTEHEKLLPYFEQTIIHLETFMGKSFVKYCIDNKKIQLKSGEYLRGRSFENVLVLVEESQNFTFDDLEMVLTRLGKNATFIFTGDTKQNDMKGNSGLDKTIALINRMIETEPSYMQDEDLDCLADLIGGVEFMPEDCVRDALTRALVKMYYHNS